MEMTVGMDDARGFTGDLITSEFQLTKHLSRADLACADTFTTRRCDVLLHLISQRWVDLACQQEMIELGLYRVDTVVARRM